MLNGIAQRLISLAYANQAENYVMLLIRLFVCILESEIRKL